MKLTLAEPKFFKDSISIISDLVNEARFKITQDAIELVAMDPANVAMVIFKLLSSAFVEYDIKDEVELAINLSNLKQVLKRAKQNDMLTLQLDENRLKITLKGNTKRTFTLPTIELDEKEQKIPELKFPVNVVANTEILNDAIDDADIVSESILISLEDNKLVLEAEGDMSKARTEVQSGEEAKIVSDTDEKVKSKYSIEYLKKMVGGSKLTDRVTLFLNNDYPLKLEYKAIDKVDLSFILAPRVEND